jgi:hypothetical protein
MHALRVSTVTGLFLALAVGCTGKDDSAVDPVESIDPKITGTVTVEGEASAEVAIYQAFAFNQGGTMLAYLASSPSATCENVSDYLRTGQDPYDPVDMFEPSTCNFFLKIDGDYDGGYSYSQAADADQPNFATLASAMNCAMGTGEFDYFPLSESDDPDYNWNGRWWEGVPSAYVYDLSGGDGEGYTFSIEMSVYDGSFVHEPLNDSPAVGAVSGTIDATWCELLGSTGLF